MDQFSRTFYQRQRSVVLGLAMFPLLIGLSTVGFMILEDWSFSDSFYMAIITISTVGFQEVHPLSVHGQFFAAFVIFTAVVLAVYASTKVGQLILQGEFLDLIGRRKMLRLLQKAQKHFVVCGFGRVGRPVAEGLQEAGHTVCVIDGNPDVESELEGAGFLYLIGDATDDEVLKLAGLERARALMALLPSDADNLYLTMTAKTMHPELTVIARANDSKSEVKLKRGGANKVISVYEMVGHRVLQAVLRPTVLDLLDLATHRQHLALALEEIVVGAHSPLNGPSIAEAEIRSRYGVIIIAIKRRNGEMVFNPDPTEKIHAGDILVAIGRDSALGKLERAGRGFQSFEPAV